MRFTEIKNRGMAKRCIKKHFPWVKSCDFRGCDIVAINDVVSCLLELEENYPEAARLIEVIETVRYFTEPDHDPVLAHWMAIYKDGTLSLNPLYYKDNSRIVSTLEAAFQSHRFIPYRCANAAYPVEHAFAHVLVEWIASLDIDLTIGGDTGKAVDVLLHHLVPQSLDQIVSLSAFVDDTELFAEAFCAHCSGFFPKNVIGKMELIREIQQRVHQQI